MTRNYRLVVPILCSCGHDSDLVAVVVSGPHLRANCQKCGSYLRFLKKSEAEALRLHGEDRKVTPVGFYIVTASKREGLGVITRPSLATRQKPEAEREQSRLVKLGYISTIDRITPHSKDLRKDAPQR